MATSLSTRLIGAIAGAALIGSAQAAITDPGITFTATNAQGTGSVFVTLAQGAPLPSGGWQWVLVGPPVAITTGGGQVLGTISQGSVTIQDSGGLVATSFAVTAGGFDTQFAIQSAVVSFSPMGGMSARASAGVTATDNTGNGASVSGNRPGGSMFSARYNGITPGTTFADLIAGPVVEPNAFGSTASSQAQPAAPGVFAPVPGAVADMSSIWDFSVTAMDQASGTSVFVLVPTPGGLAVLGLGGLVLGTRRRA